MIFKLGLIVAMQILKIFDFLNLISGIITLIMGMFIYRTRKSGYHCVLSSLFFSVAFWNFTSLFDGFSTTLNDHIFWYSLSYLGSLTTPVFLFLFLYQYTHFNKSITKPFTYLLFIIPLVSNVLIWIPVTRSFTWSSINLTNTPLGPIAHFEHGWWYYIQAYSSFILVGMGIFYLIRGLSLFPQQYSKSIKLLLLSSLIPLIISYGYSLNSYEFYGLDVTPVAISISSLLFYSIITRQQLLNSTPIAWNNVVENINEGILIISNDGKIVGSNPAFKNITVSLCQLNAESRTIDEMFKDCPIVKEFLIDSSQTRKFLSTHDHYYEVTKNPVFDNAGMESGLILIFYNMTEIKKKEQEIETMNHKLKEANETKDMIFKLISHDLRGPMGNITSLLGLFVEQGKALEGHNLETLYKTSGSASFLIENLLYWANSQRNEIVINPVCNSISDTVSNAIETLNFQAHNKNVAIRNLCNINSSAFFDAPTLEIVIRNMISNAIKFTNPGGYVEISTKTKQNKVVISITDNGIGMSDELVANIRNNIIVQSNYGTMNEKGTGIGLPMCHKLVAANKGTLTISSVLNIGTTISIALSTCC